MDERCAEGEMMGGQQGELWKWDVMLGVNGVERGNELGWLE